MAAQINMPTKEQDAFYILSYQGSTRLYNEFDLKKELAKIIIAQGGKDLKSYTDSTIIFQGEYTLATFNKLKNAIEAKCNAFRPKVYFSLLLAAKGDNSFIYVDGDQELNTHFKAILDSL